MQFKLFETVKDMKTALQNNEPRLVLTGKKNVCVVRKGKELIAFHNECPHMGQGLSDGNINHFNEIVCPLHAYKFNLTTGQEENKRCSDLKFVKVDIRSDGVYLSLS